MLTKNHYLGSDAFEFTDERYDQEAYELLFSDHFVKLYEQDGDRPSLLIGRRGAGKSSYLNNLAQKDHVIPVAARSWELVDHVETQVRKILEKREGIDVETVSTLWHLIFVCLWSSASAQALGDLKAFDGEDAKDFLKSIAGGTAEQIAQIAMSKLTALLEKHDYHSFSSETISTILFTGPNLGAIERSISKALDKHGKYVVVLLDNPEDVSQNNATPQEVLQASQNDANLARKKTFAGLLDFLGRVHKGNVHVQARYCIAAEQFFWLKSVSEANKKNFGDTQMLHWSSGELLSAVAHRYMVFMCYVIECRTDLRFEALCKIPIYSRPGAIEFFSTIFAGHVENGRGFSEDATTYLLRHTQLLPRQLIAYINSAIKIEADSGSDDLSRIQPDSLKEAIADSIDKNAREILSSYRLIYPFVREDKILDIIRHIPLIATYAEVADSWSKIGAKSLLTKYEQAGHPQVFANKDYFMRFLSEVGIIGKVIDKRLPTKTNRGYVNAEFEYTLPDTLSCAKDTLIAVHPVFSNGLNTDLTTRDLAGVIGVYPYGTNPESDNSPSSLRKMKDKYVG